jgi:hypothetical protein
MTLGSLGSTATPVTRPVTDMLPAVWPLLIGAGPSENQPSGTLEAAPAPCPWMISGSPATVRLPCTSMEAPLATTVPPDPCTRVPGLTVRPALGVALSCGWANPDMAPSKVTVRTFPALLTVTEPPTLVTDERPLSAACTSAARVAEVESSAPVIWPLNVSVNVPDPFRVSVCTSETPVPPRARLLATTSTPWLTKVVPA